MGLLSSHCPSLRPLPTCFHLLVGWVVWLVASAVELAGLFDVAVVRALDVVGCGGCLWVECLGHWPVP